MDLEGTSTNVDIWLRHSWFVEATTPEPKAFINVDRPGYPKQFPGVACSAYDACRLVLVMKPCYFHAEAKAGMTRSVEAVVA